MSTTLDFFDVLLSLYLCLGKVHPVPAFALMRKLPGNVCRFNSPQPASFERRINLRGDGPESPATYIHNKGAAPSQEDANGGVSDHRAVSIARSEKFLNRQQGAAIMAGGDETRKDAEECNQEAPNNVIEIGSRRSNREANSGKNPKAIVRHPRGNVIEISRRSLFSAT